jgi:hypothetical protein
MVLLDKYLSAWQNSASIIISFRRFFGGHPGNPENNIILEENER